MKGIELLVEEHKLIKRMLVVVRKACVGVMKGDDINYEDFGNIIDFIRNYADRHHHGKEEKLLFNRMVSEIGGPAEKLVKHGMLVEHDLGRQFIMGLEEALAEVKGGKDEARLDVIANAVSYTHLLFRHIDKEDDVAYPFAQRLLREETLSSFDKDTLEFEEQTMKEGIQNKYMEVLESLERKYLV
jgi:hemerythrin-like domain-containing protein